MHHRRPSCRPRRPLRPARLGMESTDRQSGERNKFRVPIRTAPAFPPGLEVLKLNLLRHALLTFCEPQLERPLRRAAEQAARLAMGTDYPMLVFPELFLELAIPAMVETEYRRHGGFLFAARHLQ